MKKVMYVFLICVAMALTVPVSNVNAQLFDEGDIVLSAGFGLGSTYVGGWNNYYKIGVPPVFVAGDYCLREDLGPGNLGVGGIMAFSSYKYEPYPDWGYKYSVFMIGARGSYHFTDLVDNLDLYGGVVIGGQIVTDKEYGTYTPGYSYTTNSSGVLYDLFAGARYYFADNLAVMGELGYGIAWLKAGISLKL